MDKNQFHEHTDKVNEWLSKAGTMDHWPVLKKRLILDQSIPCKSPDCLTLWSQQEASSVNLRLPIAVNKSQSRNSLCWSVQLVTDTLGYLFLGHKSYPTKTQSNSGVSIKTGPSSADTVASPILRPINKSSLQIPLKYGGKFQRHEDSSCFVSAQQKRTIRDRAEIPTPLSLSAQLVVPFN